ncbi:hypothetical protein [Arsenophonus apicola]|uniref:hypothetical protein n=1 Tax=Arsenophonus apicola TaxID=2879119 RepID=UPI001CDCE542|nr:hypothetical protein [Arsenophonus apicola]UBX30979.1 hypothetical protein LDL57_17540 [Arsenophonus apicola]
MSSIKLINTRHGCDVIRVHFENAVGRFHKSFKTLDPACRFLFLSESERFLSMTAKEKEQCRDWPLRKLIQFYVGKKVSQCETGHLRQSSLDTIKHALFSIDETLQAKLTSSPTFTLRDSGGGFPLVGDYLIAQKPGSCC